MEAASILSAPGSLKPGIYPDLSMAEYLALPAMSASRLEVFRRSPLQLQHALTQPSKSSPALERGTALHLALLEPAKFEGHYVTLGQCRGKKRDGERCGYQGSVYRDGESYCKTHDPAKGEPPDTSVEVLAEGEHEKVVGMAAAVRALPRAWSMFEGQGLFEATIVFEDPETGILIRIRPDRLVERAGMHVAVKTTRDASEAAFQNDAERRGYFRSLALYRRGLRVVGWPYQYTAVLAIESEPPFDLDCLILEEGDNEAALETADQEVSRHLSDYADCLRENSWPGYCRGAGFRTLRRPAWAVKRNPSVDI